MRGRKGFTLVEIMIVVAIIGLLAAIAIPSFIKARESSQTNACINNLRQIDAAKEQWALANKKVTGDAVVLLHQAAAGTGFDADAAADAPRLQPVHLRSRVYALRVVAPTAMKRAAFEEYGGTDARAVFGGQSLRVQEKRPLFACVEREDLLLA